MSANYPTSQSRTSIPSEARLTAWLGSSAGIRPTSLPSSDGTLVVWQIQGVGENSTRYEVAYDFRLHRMVGVGRDGKYEQNRANEITSLVRERGGLEPVEVPGLNSGAFD